MSANQAAKAIYKSSLDSKEKEIAILGIVFSLLPKKLNPTLGHEDDTFSPCIFIDLDKYYKIKVNIDGWVDCVEFFLNESYEKHDTTIYWEGVGFDKLTEDVKRAITKGVMSR